MNVLMVGVDKQRIGGMWSVAEVYINSKRYNDQVNLKYVATSTCGSKVKRLAKMLTGYLRILWILTTSRIDIVHIHMAEKGSVYRKGIVVYLAKIYKKKVLIQMHAGPFLEWYNTQSENRRKKIRKIFEKSDKIAVLGEYWKQQIIGIIPKEKVVVLYNGSYCPNENSYNPNGNIITYLGLMKKTKGIFDLIEAISSINDKLNPSIKVYLCGSDEEGNIKKIIDEKHLNERIELLGWIDKKKRLEIFNDTQICVLPSYFEALSMTVIEAMCFGIPMLTTNISTMSELLGDNIERVDPGDWGNLSRILLEWSENKDKRIEISKEEYLRAKEYFSIDKNINSTIDIYNRIMDGV